MSLQVVEPRIRGFISLTSHPEGCAANIREQVEVVRRAGITAHIGTVLVIGSSTGYGLASALVACFGYGARTLGVCLEKAPEETKTATAGWYNLAEAHRLARAEGRTFETINGDAFSAEVKQQTVDALRRLGPVDLVIYSLAAPRRRDTHTGEIWNSTLKPIGRRYTGKAFDLRGEAVTSASIDAATRDEIENTVRVMGGEDWSDWIELLLHEQLLAPGARTIAYSYIGPELTAAIYRDGTIGHAKEHLEETGHTLDRVLGGAVGGGAWVSVNKAVVTQASAAIPAVPLYLSVLMKLMKERGTHEEAIEQIVRLFRDYAAPGVTPATDAHGRIRLDDREMAPDVQSEVAAIWEQLSTENFRALSDYGGYRLAFHRLFGFDVPGVDYGAPTEVNRSLDQVGSRPAESR
ncbi:MAG: enoyl-ACP reductase FabV [Dehalococcoidia bacterium]